MAKTRAGLIAAIDIGTTKVACFVARANGAGGIRVSGVGHHASSGMRAGTIVDMEAAQASILTAVTAAEQLANERLSKVFVNLSGGRLASRTMGFEVSIAGHEVGEADLSRIFGYGRPKVEQPDQELIHCIPTGYSIDGSNGIRDPRGMFGESLAVNMHLVTASSAALRNLATCVARCHLDIEALVVSPYAAGLAVLVEDEVDLGATLVDMGGGATTIAVFYDGNVIYTDSIPTGGVNVTKDIARGLSTPLVHAERMKTLYGSAIAAATDERELIDVPLVGEENHAHANHVPRSVLTGIIRPRIEETFELVRDRLENSGVARHAGRRLVLTGGACQLQGVPELAALMLEKQVRIGRPLRTGGLADATSGPAFATCAGMLRFAVEKFDQSRDYGGRAAEMPIGPISKFSQWLRENF